jgi:hypothetical protein
MKGRLTDLPIRESRLFLVNLFGGMRKAGAPIFAAMVDARM